MLAPTRILRASWSSTLRLPKSSFPPRPISASSAEYLRRCTDDLYKWQRSEARFDAPLTGIDGLPLAAGKGISATYLPTTFTLHDGPPYANGPLHIGHALNKITKDIICRFEVGQGKEVSYIPGWDCHGLPIEIKALQAQKKEATQSEPVAIRKAARQLATDTIEQQMHGFKEWAVMGDWDNAYKTMERGFEIRQLRVFKTMFEKGLIYRQNKPVYWSPSSRTALAEAELEYDEEHKSLAAFVRFPAQLSSDLKAGKLKDLDGNVGIVIWTTTPWTLPANSAIAVHNDIQYCVVEDASRNDELSLIAESRVAEYEKVLERKLRVIVSGLSGSDLAGHLRYENPFQRARGQQLVVHAGFVTDSSGTGLVHMAAGHGMDDYHVCQELGLPAFAPIDDAGAFTKEAFPEHPELLQGLLVADEKKSGSNAVCDYLEQTDMLRMKQAYTHKYPIDWRTKQPVVTRATEQWFANVESIMRPSINATEEVRFLPESGRSRLQSFISGRSQWCISRQRAWGVPIPALYKVDGDNIEAIMDSKSIEHIIQVIQERGIDAWWTDPENDPSWIAPHLTGSHVRGRDTMDVWFDSGTSWTLLPQQGDQPIADVYLEGTDQHRGWFQSSLLTHVATQNYNKAMIRPPFKTLITHGFTLDSEGRKMSKSLGNVISPSQIMSGELLPPVKRKKQKGNKANIDKQGVNVSYDAMGADALRLWAAGSDYMRDVTIGQPVLQAVNQALHKYRVTFKWLLGIFSLPSCPPRFSSFNDLSTEQPEGEGSVSLSDCLAIHRLVQVSAEVHAHYAKYEFFKGVNVINKYIANDLSAFYFETLKDRIYTGDKLDCQHIQHDLGLIFYELLKMLAPITPLLVEEVWDHVPPSLRENTTHPARTHWTPLAQPSHPLGHDMQLMNGSIQELGTSIKSAQERLRTDKKIGSPLESSVTLYLSPSAAQDLHQQFITCTHECFDAAELIEAELASIFVVSGFNVRVEESHALGTSFDITQDSIFDAENPQEILARSAWYQEETIPSKDGDVGFLAQGARVVVHPPAAEKCPRCWRFVKEPEEEICKRCDGVVKSEVEL